MKLDERLNQVRFLKRKITEVETEITSLKSCMLPGRYMEERIQKNTKSDGVAELLSLISDREETINHYHSKIPAAVNDLLELFDTIQDQQKREVMKLWYIGGKSAEEIKNELYYTDASSIYKLHRKAVKELETKFQ